MRDVIETKSFKITLVDHGPKGRDVLFERRDPRIECPLAVAPVLELIEELSEARAVIAKFADGSSFAPSALRAYLDKYEV